MIFGCGNNHDLCAVCDKDCWYSPTNNDIWYALSHECPKYKCDRPDDGFMECEHCGFIDSYIRDVYGKAVYDDYQNRKHSRRVEET